MNANEHLNACIQCVHLKLKKTEKNKTNDTHTHTKDLGQFPFHRLLLDNVTTHYISTYHSTLIAQFLIYKIWKNRKKKFNFFLFLF